MRVNKSGNLLNQILLLLLIIFFAVQVSACGNREEEYIYVAEHITLGDFAYIHSPAASQTTIYFCDSSAVYAFDPESDQSGRKLIGDFGLTNIVCGISPNPDNSLDLAILCFDETTGVLSDLIIKRIGQYGIELNSISVINGLSKEENNNSENIFPTKFLTDDNGFIYIAVNESVYIWDAAGDLKHQIPVGGWVYEMSFNRDGRLYIAWHSNFPGVVIAEVDIETGKIKQTHEIEEINILKGMTPGFTSDLLLASEKGIHGYDTANRSQSDMLSFSNVDIPVDWYSEGTLISLPDSRMGWLMKNQDSGQTDLWLIRPLGKNEEFMAREKLVLGLIPSFIDQPVRKAVIDFNQNNPLYQIVIKEYENISPLNVDIIAGNVPDMLLLPRRFMMDIYAELAVFTDLYPMLDLDASVARTDLQENILKAYEINGQLFGMPINYMIRTIVAAHSQVGGLYSWTLDEMIDYVNKQLPRSQVFDDASKSGVLDICLKANGDILIDWKNDGAFNQDLFIEMLDFANQFTPDHLYTGGDYIEEIQNKRIQLLVSNLNTVAMFQAHVSVFGEPVAYPGFPAVEGGGNLAESRMLVSISKSCLNQEAAWSFISSMLTEEFQNYCTTLVKDFPIRKSVLEAQINEAMTATYYTDEDGYTREEIKGTVSTSGSDLVMELYAATEEEIELIRNLIASVTKIHSWDERIDAILKEEAQLFYSGAKSAAEAAAVAANRIGIYVSELR